MRTKNVCLILARDLCECLLQLRVEFAIIRVSQQHVEQPQTIARVLIRIQTRRVTKHRDTSTTIATTTIHEMRGIVQHQWDGVDHIFPILQFGFRVRDAMQSCAQHSRMYRRPHHCRARLEIQFIAAHLHTARGHHITEHDAKRAQQRIQRDHIGAASIGIPHGARVVVKETNVANQLLIVPVGKHDNRECVLQHIKLYFLQLVRMKLVFSVHQNKRAIICRVDA
mmetsp:Transcript_41700/g.68607  ORF Transcript_41700/g.68607 Transcript_41700/m.68607 type:complete len:225 (+) Transcript_41700:340-1014(+)